MGITVYEDRDFGGVRETFGEGFFNITDNDDSPQPNNVLNDSISSYVLEPYTRVTFYWDVNRGGAPWVHENSSASPLRVNYVGDRWNDQISSFLVETMSLFPPDAVTPLNVVPGLAGVTLFEDVYYNAPRIGGPLLRPRSQTFDGGTQGRQYSLPHEPQGVLMGRFRFQQLGVRPQSVSSIKVGEGYYVVLLDGLEHKTFLESTPDIGKVAPGWDNRARSVLVWRRA